MSEEVFQAKGNLMKSIQTFLEKFNRISFGEMPKVLLQAWEKFFAIQHAQPEDTNELFQKLLEDLQIINERLAEYINSSSWNQKEEPSQNSNIRQLIREECGKKVCDGQKQNMEDTMLELLDVCRQKEEECGKKVCDGQKQNMKDTMLELLEVCRQKEFYCMHNDVDDLIESALNSKLLSINLRSQRLDKKKQEIKDIVEQPTKRGTLNAITPVLPTEEPEYSLSMEYEHLNTIPEMKSDEVIKSSVEKLVPIPSECKVTSDNESECDVTVCKDSSTFDVLKDHSEILSDFNNDDISSDGDAFEDIEYVKASLPDFEIVSLEEENDVYQEKEEFNLEYILQIQDVILREKLLSINRLIADIEFLNDNPTSNRVLKSSASFLIFEKSNNSLPKFETFSDHTEETRSGSTTAHANNSLAEYDSFCFEIKPNQERLCNAPLRKEDVIS
nr:hypothetical protein [Tanacetum cinerariifolium]